MSVLKLIDKEVVLSIKFFGVHLLGKSKQITGRLRLVIAHFTCREDRTWFGDKDTTQKKGSRYSFAEYLPSATRKINKII